MSVRSFVAGLSSLILLASVSVACGDSLRERGEHDPERYKTAVARAERAGLQAYWLGPQLDVGGEPFNAIEGIFPEGIAGVGVQGVQLAYLNLDEFRGRLDITTLSPADWAAARDAVRSPEQPPVTTIDTVVAGRQAELISIRLDGPDLTGLKLVIDYGDSFVIAETSALIVEGGDNVNPLLDEATFLSVVENLRPYPE
jgi:hypothetical protein